MTVDESFWRGKRVFLTGHTGFKGAWLALWLQRLGADVTGFALPPHTTPSLFEVARVAEGMVSVFGDIRDGEHLAGVLANARPEIVLHLAAQSLVRPSYRHPVETYSTNVMGLVHLLEAVRQTSGVRAVVNVTSDKCYENREWLLAYREIDRLGGYDPYSNSKACAEMITAAYRSSFFHPDRYECHLVALASARAGNVIGGGDWAQDRLIPDLIRAIESGQPVSIRYPGAIRPWQHVLEPLAGYLLLAERLYCEGPAFAEAWNFGPSANDARSVSYVVEQLIARWAEGASWVHDEQPQPHEATYLRLDCAKSGARLNWHPKWSLENALAQIVDWHLAHSKAADMRSITLTQIEEYMTSA